MRGHHGGNRICPNLVTVSEQRGLALDSHTEQSPPGLPAPGLGTHRGSNSSSEGSPVVNQACGSLIFSLPRKEPETLVDTRPGVQSHLTTECVRKPERRNRGEGCGGGGGGWLRLLSKLYFACLGNSLLAPDSQTFRLPQPVTSLGLMFPVIAIAWVR